MRPSRRAGRSVERKQSADHAGTGGGPHAHLIGSVSKEIGALLLGACERTVWAGAINQRQFRGATFTFSRDQVQFWW
jgi:hypothetical protein